ncbi:MAG: alpha/beta fold hydrolase [Chitinophagales bacterium]
MKLYIISLFVTIVSFGSCNEDADPANNKTDFHSMTTDTINFKNDYSDVNGIRIYYEIYGKGDTLVLIHGGGSTIQSSFGRIIPELAKAFTLLAIEMQNHGRSGFRNEPETFEQDADDVIALLRNLGISNANFLGFSNGGTTAMLIGHHHPEMVNKLVLIAPATKRDGFLPGFFDGMQQATLENMPEGLQKSFLEVNPDSAQLQIMFEKDRDRMIGFKDWNNEDIKSISAPTLLINGDNDVTTTEHALEMSRLMTDCKLAIIPGAHGEYIGEVTTLNNKNAYTDATIALIVNFLKD